MDEIPDYIVREDRNVQLVGTWISILLYGDDIVLIGDSFEGLQRPLDILHSFGVSWENQVHSV